MDNFLPNVSNILLSQLLYNLNKNTILKSFGELIQPIGPGWRDYNKNADQTNPYKKCLSYNSIQEFYEKKNYHAVFFKNWMVKIFSIQKFQIYWQIFLSSFFSR